MFQQLWPPSRQQCVKPSNATIGSRRHPESPMHPSNSTTCKHSCTALQRHRWCWSTMEEQSSPTGCWWFRWPFRVALARAAAFQTVAQDIAAQQSNWHAQLNLDTKPTCRSTKAIIEQSCAKPNAMTVHQAACYNRLDKTLD